MVRLVIVRHGYSLYNKEKRFTGQADIPLTEIGIEEARLTADYVLKQYQIDAIYSSDLSRAVDTAKPIAEALGLPIHTTDQLRELNVGVWQDMLFEDVYTDYYKEYQYYKEHPDQGRAGVNGECFTELQKRALSAIAQIVAENEGKTVLVTSHGGTIRSLRCAWMGIALKDMYTIAHVPNASVTEVIFEEGKPQIVVAGYAEHLKPAEEETKVV